MKKLNEKGFTLIELLVVIAIIGLLSTMAVVSLNGARSKARDARRTSDIKAMQTALEMYKADNNDVFTGVTADWDTWSEIQGLLSLYLPQGMPLDPTNTAGEHEYNVCIDAGGDKYLISGTLENDPASAGVQGATATWVLGDCTDSNGDSHALPDCNTADVNFCMGSLDAS